VSVFSNEANTLSGYEVIVPRFKMLNSSGMSLKETEYGDGDGDGEYELSAAAIVCLS